jgi:hypothetical protein
MFALDHYMNPLNQSAQFELYLLHSMFKAVAVSAPVDYDDLITKYHYQLEYLAEQVANASTTAEKYAAIDIRHKLVFNPTPAVWVRTV